MMPGPLAEEALPIQSVPGAGVREFVPRPAVSQPDANPAQSLLPRMSVAAILDDAMVVFGLPLHERQALAWQRLVELVNWLDVVVDGQESGRQRELLSGVATVAEGAPAAELDPGLGVGTTEAVWSFGDACDAVGLDLQCRRDWAGNFRLLAVEHSVGHRIADIEGYIQHRTQTGRLLGLMFADLIPMRCRGAAFEALASWVGSLGSCAELIDSFWDLPEDYRRGHSALKPSVRNRAGLVRAARDRAPEVLRPLPARMHRKLAAKVLLMGANRSGRLNRFRTAA
jgi:hypothetical protein